MISIIICTYNREAYIGKVLEALSRESYTDFETIVVDNNSTDSTPLVIKDFQSSHPEFPLRILSERKQGLSWARNCGIRAAKGDLLVFLDDDAIPEEGYVERLAENMKAHPQAGAFGGRIIPTFESGEAPKWLCKWSLGWVSGLDMGQRVCYFEGRKFPIGANMGFRRSVLDAVGEFNPELGRNGGNLMGGEEKDLFNRVKAAGYGIVYLPDVCVRHMIPQSRTTVDYVRKFADGVGKSERVRCKNEGSYPKRLLSEAVKWIATIVLFFYYILTMRPSPAATLVLFRAHVTRSLLSGK
mgnify:FL=1